MVRLRLLPNGSSTLVVGAGFLGTAIGEALLAAGRPVTVLSRSSLDGRTARRLAGARVLVGDAASRTDVAGALEGAGNVVYAAGSPVAAAAEADPVDAERQAIPPLLTLLEAVRRLQGVRLLYLSSGGTVYGEPTVDPVPEHHPLRPTTVYATLRIAAEHHLLVARSQHGVPATSLRCANPSGAGQQPGREQGVIATMLAAEAPVPVYGDGNAVRDYIEVHDLAAAVVALLARDELPPAINVGTGIGTSLHGVLDAVRRVSGRTVEVVHEPRRSTDLHRVVLDVSLLRSLIAFAPVGLEAGIARMCADGLRAAHAEG
jgi:UDP-glucose 4-epimerase